MKRTLLVVGLLLATGGLAFADAPGTMDGLNIPTDYAGSSELAVQTNRTGWGDQQISTGDYTPGSEIDAMFLAKDSTYLYVGLTGNLERNGHEFVIFIDTPAFQGQTELRAEGVEGPPYTVQTAGREVVVNTNGPGDPSDDTWSYGANGTIMPCEVDYAVSIDVYGGTMSGSQYLLFYPDPMLPVGTIDPTPGNLSDPLQNLYALRSFVAQTPTNDGNEILENQADLGFYKGGFMNTNTTGVTGADATYASVTTTGLEIAIPLANIGYGLTGSEEIKVFVALMDGAGSTGAMANQFLPPTTSNGLCNPPVGAGMRPDLTTKDVTCKTVNLATLPTFAGTCEGVIKAAEYGGPAVETQTCPTAYGDQQWDPNIGVPSGGSELDALYADNDDTYLYLAITGNIEGNGNSFDIFIDTDPDGADAGAHIVPAGMPGSVGGMSGDELPNSALPADFAVKYNYAYRLNTGGGGNNVWVNYYNLETPAEQYRGNVPLTNGQSGTAVVLTGGTNPNNMMMGVNNRNEDGVIGCGDGQACHLETASEVAARAYSATKGYEVAIPLADIGLASVSMPHHIRVWVYLAGNDGWGSDQALPSLRNVSGDGLQINSAGGGPNNYTDPFNATPYKNYEARAADYTLLPGIPAATVTAAVSGASAACKINLLAAGAGSSTSVTEPRSARIGQVTFTFDVAPAAGTPTIEQTTAWPTWVAYSGASVPACAVVGNDLTCTFTPALENARTYRFTLGPAEGISSITNTVKARGLVGDVNNSGVADGTDRAVVIGVWTGVGYTCLTDLNVDTVTNGTDRAVVIGSWTGGSNTAP